MAAIGQYIYNYLSAAMSGTSLNETNTSPHEPSVADVLEVKDILRLERCLPVELIDTIIDYAEYWPHTTTTTSGQNIARGNTPKENLFIVSIRPLHLRT